MSFISKFVNKGILKKLLSKGASFIPGVGPVLSGVIDNINFPKIKVRGESTPTNPPVEQQQQQQQFNNFNGGINPPQNQSGMQKLVEWAKHNIALVVGGVVLIVGTIWYFVKHKGSGNRRR
jgi:hypothetical protein